MQSLEESVMKKLALALAAAIALTIAAAPAKAAASADVVMSCTWTTGSKITHAGKIESGAGHKPMNSMVVVLDDSGAYIGTKNGVNEVTLIPAKGHFVLIEKVGMGVNTYSITPDTSGKMRLMMAKNYGAYAGTASGWCTFEE
jgi:hypothetical protein